jgi:hypothetical protein
MDDVEVDVILVACRVSHDVRLPGLVGLFDDER